MTTDKGREPYLFIISSVIYFKDKSLEYSLLRSVFDYKEREVQTLKTIQSIKSKVPNSYIVLIESGLNQDIDREIIKVVDQYIYTGHHKLVRWACDGKKKGLGEAVSLYYGLKQILPLNYKYCFKISGRYYLNENFNALAYDDTKDISLKTYNNPLQMSTRLYGFSNCFLKTLHKSLPFLFFGLYKNKSIEELLYARVKKYQIQKLETLGVSGLIGPNGNEINE